MDLAEFCRRLPKVELHVHLLGAIRLETLAEMAQRQGAGYTPEEVEELARRDARPKGVLHILRALERRILRGPDMQSVSLPGLFPAGEGAGYAGGIISSAVDGLRVAEAAALTLCGLPVGDLDGPASCAGVAGGGAA